eukprot:Unigene4241_Nuclearia_a/m.12917 Unigene4241_Nuclearia_a/g.12917  ORF Unigene4241_Nuclearia_a/g.12917 Unigene4241_Nuclearia_a/m.12917 type:complete len:351 (+) Unigene4241_Nuclearia_a:896-1948(+)
MRCSRRASSSSALIVCVRCCSSLSSSCRLSPLDSSASRVDAADSSRSTARSMFMPVSLSASIPSSRLKPISTSCVMSSSGIGLGLSWGSWIGPGTLDGGRRTIVSVFFGGARVMVSLELSDAERLAVSLLFGVLALDAGEGCSSSLSTAVSGDPPAVAGLDERSMMSMMTFSFFIARVVINGCVSSALASARFLGFLLRHASRNLWKLSDHLALSVSVGCLCLGIIKSARIGCRSYSGGASSAISIAVIPSDHTSHRESYATSVSSAEIPSGAIQYGLPMTVLRLLSVLVSCAETPKSASLTAPSCVRSRLPPLMSRWMSPVECRYARPWSPSRMTAWISTSLKGFCVAL